MEDGPMEDGPMGEGPRSWRSIRYATGARFAPPVAVSFDAAAVMADGPRGPICPQTPSRLQTVTGPQAPLRQDEDCRVLTVTTTSRSGSRPVMVWLHGGAYLSGGGELPWYDGDALVAEHDVVFVSVSYRLGAFGYLRRPGMTGPSPGLADQIEALRWVQANIVRFGGDPAAVTVFGQSAGAHSIQALIEWGHGGTLFHRAILQSNPYQPLLTVEQSSAIYDAFVHALSDDPATAPVEDILRAQVAVMRQGNVALPFAPAAPAQAMKGRRFDVLTGWNRNDAAPFVLSAREPGWLHTIPGRLLTFLGTRRVFARGSRTVAALARAAGGRVVFYRLNWKAMHNPLGSCHCIELPLLLGDDAAWRSAPMLMGAEPPGKTIPGRGMRFVWASFAKDTVPVTLPTVMRRWLSVKACA